MSRSKGNPTMKLDHLIECKMKNTFLEKSCTKCRGERIPRPFSKKSKLSNLLIKNLKFHTVCFYHMTS